MTALAIAALVLAAGPAILFLRNLHVFQPPVKRTDFAADVAVLIPARNEACNIGPAIEAALANRGVEVLVLDDLSMDGTAGVVAKINAREPRVRLIEGATLPPGWCGKNWACAQLAAATGRPLLLFVDADVRLAPHAAATISHFLRESGAQFASGVPSQVLGSFGERLLIPLIHFVLLAFLPLQRMRRSRHPAYATGCGQLIVADAEAYGRAGGHTEIRGKIHDGLALPRAFRLAGFQTDVFDATEISTCRMYRSSAETWRGFSKNTHEGLGAPARIVPATLLLLVGQVLPFGLLAATPSLATIEFLCAFGAASLALLPRFVAAARFRQPWSTAFLHPLGIAALLGIQWLGLIRFWRGRPALWKGRMCHSETENRKASVPCPGSVRW
ncbi:MAG: glycosyltransferase family 2 protein [Verrucomicrobiota bacterium]|nr:glycosyltransferase family 2 protein [Verrucomicrobiota bacterium]